MSDPSFPIETLAVRPWADPVVEAVGHDPRSRYVEQFWLGVLGPSSTWLLRRFADGLDEQPDGFDLDLAPTAQSLGLGTRGGRNSPFMRSIGRCCQFGLAHYFDERTLLVRRSVPPLSARQLDKLPSMLQRAHGSWADPPPAVVAARREHARRMALTLLELGEPPDAVESMLHRWQVHPALAHEAMRWARSVLGSSDAAVDAAPLPDAPLVPPHEPAESPTEQRAQTPPGRVAEVVAAATARPKRIPPPPPFIADPLG